MEKPDVNTTTALAIFFVTAAVVLIAGPVVTAVTQQAAFAQPTNPKKVTICHDPLGSRETITVGAPAVAAHVRNHGDTIGPCVDEEPEPVLPTFCFEVPGGFEPDLFLCFDTLELCQQGEDAFPNRFTDCEQFEEFPAAALHCTINELGSFGCARIE
jgi:hypothetical protein